MKTQKKKKEYSKSWSSKQPTTNKKKVHLYYIYI